MQARGVPTTPARVVLLEEEESHLQVTSYKLQADDTTIYESASDIHYLYISMNSNLSRLTDWFRGNKLSLNVARTTYMLFSHHISTDESLELKIADQTIIQTNCSKFLGIHIDDKLKWNIHIDKIKLYISSSLFAINKIKHFAPKIIMKTLYYSMIFPYLIYGINLLVPELRGFGLCRDIQKSR